MDGEKQIFSATCDKGLLGYVTYKLSTYFYLSSLGPSYMGHFKLGDNHLNKYNKRPLGHATYQISSTCIQWFCGRKYLNMLLYTSMVQTHWSTGSGEEVFTNLFTIYGRGDYVGRVTRLV